ncbi:MAG: putative rane protein [Myxococcaceae bacterium]|nr:putative rane protein [Myxococcaceae bacterium]
MLQRFLALATRLVLERRTALLITACLLTLVAAAALPRISADPSPRALLASADDGAEQIASEFRERFGSTDNVIALVIESPPSVLRPEALGYLYRLGEEVQKLPGVERVDSLTKMAFPKPEAAGEEVTLEDLDAKPNSDPTADDPKLLGALTDVVAAAPDLFPMGLASLSERTAGMQNLGPLITSEKPSAEEVQALQKAVEATPILRGRLISRSGHQALLAITLDDAIISHVALSDAVDKILTLLKTHPAPRSVRVYATGLPVLRTAIVTNMQRDQRVLTPATLVVSLLMLVLAFRWWAAVTLPLLKVALTSLWVIGGMALFGVKINVITNIIPALLIIMGLTDSIHLVSRYMYEYARVREPDKALGATIGSIGEACFGTASTTAAGFFALYVSKTHMLAEFGVVAGLGVMLAYLDTLVFLPAMLRGLKPPMKEAKHELERAVKPGRLERLLSRMTLRILQHPWWVVAGSLAFTVVATVTSLGLRVDSALLDQFKKSDPMYLATELLEREFEGVRPLEVSFSSAESGHFYGPDTLQAIDRVGRWLEKQPGVLSVTAPSLPFVQTWSALSGTPANAQEALRTRPQLEGMAYVLGKRTPNPVAPLITADGRHARLRVRLRDTGSRATLALVAALEGQLKRALGSDKSVSFAFTGDAYLSSHGLDAVVSDLTGSLGVAVLTILVLVFLSFHSVPYTLLLIPPNVIPMVLVMAWMVWRDIPLNAATAIIFSVSIGITVDAGIHLLSRLREELAEELLLTTAIMRSVRGTGRAIVVACVTLVLGFSVLLLSNFVPVQRFAELIAISIASCLVSTLVVLPALLAVVGRKFVAPKPGSVITSAH